MIKHIVCALDGSPHGAAAEELTFQLASALGACVRGVHVIDTAIISGAFVSDISGAMGFEPFLRLQAQVEQSLTELSQLLKDRFLSRAQEANLSSKFQIHRGNTVDKLCEEARLADLLVVGQRGTSASQHQNFLGSVTSRLLRRCPVPLLLTPERAWRPQKPLVAFDASPKAVRALRLAGELALALQVPLQVVTFSQNESQAQAHLAQAAEVLQPFKVEARFGWERAEAVEQGLLAMLDPAEHDFLFMGAHGHGRIVEAVLGSTTEYVTRHSPVPVLCATKS